MTSQRAILNSFGGMEWIYRQLCCTRNPKYLPMDHIWKLVIHCKSPWILCEVVALAMNPDPRECNIKVFSRFRPQSDAEIRAGGQNIVSTPTSDTCVHGVSHHHLAYYNKLKRKILVVTQVMLLSLTTFAVALCVLGETFYIWSRFQAKYKSRESVCWSCPGHRTRYFVR